MLIKICDRYGKQLMESSKGQCHNIPILSIIKYEGTWSTTDIDLCDECEESLLYWFKMEEVE